MDYKPALLKKMENEVKIDAPEIGSEFQLKITEDKLEVVLSIDVLTAAAADTALDGRKLFNKSPRRYSF